MAEEIYYRLRDKINEYTLGFAETESGVEIKILEYLFTVEEAEVYLNLEENVLKTPEEIASKMNRDPEEVADILKPMAEKGLAYAKFPEKEGDPVYYAACAWVHGIYENSTCASTRLWLSCTISISMKGHSPGRGNFRCGSFRWEKSLKPKKQPLRLMTMPGRS